ncbi:MAG: glutamate racemase [Rhodoferax sp.]|nr:glutamate racemase [Rhodoferax sp.]MDZ7891940.1 glutamate racemase [Rhodoferax sp.]
MHPIGVFDSGLGGLSVLRALRAELPNERFVYVADSGHAPYGERDDEYLIHRSGTISRWLQHHHQIKALVVACNTATAAAIHVLRAEHPALPIIGIEPALKPAVAKSKTGVIGVMATPSTLKSEKFQRLLASLQDQARFVLQPCPGLALAIEQFDAIKTGAACATFTRAMGTFGIQTGDIDTLVLGCTHYPFAEASLRSGTGHEVHYLEGGAPVARQTRRLLVKANTLLTIEPSNSGRIDFHSTGDSRTLALAAERWLGIADTVHDLEI